MNRSTTRKPSQRSLASRAKWQHHIHAQRSSGLGQAAYCREQGLNAKYFSLWKRKLRALSEGSASAATERAPAFIPVIMKPRTSPARAPHTATSPTDSAQPLIIKATLRNGVAIEVQCLCISGITSMLAQLSHLLC